MRKIYAGCERSGLFSKRYLKELRKSEGDLFDEDVVDKDLTHESLTMETMRCD